jgi:hypothetical protein
MDETLAGIGWDGASAIATLLASLTALYVGVFKPRRQAPSLRLLDVESDEFATTWVHVHPDDVSSAWTRIRVTNAAGHRTAENVQVIITEAFQGDPPSSLPLLIGRSLKWANENASITDIPPGVSRHIDVASIEVGDKSHSSTRRIAIYPPPRQSQRDHIEEAPVILKVALSARDTTAKYWSFRVYARSDWDGRSWELPKDQPLRIDRLKQLPTRPRLR